MGSCGGGVTTDTVAAAKEALRNDPAFALHETASKAGTARLLRALGECEVGMRGAEVAAIDAAEHLLVALQRYAEATRELPPTHAQQSTAAVWIETFVHALRNASHPLHAKARLLYQRSVVKPSAEFQKAMATLMNLTMRRVLLVGYFPSAHLDDMYRTH